MATFSTLRSTNFDQRFAQFTKVYVAHRPLVQRFLTTSFVFYVLGTTYRGLSARPGSSSKKTKATADGKDLDQAARGKPPRVAVRYLCADDCLWVSDSCVLLFSGRCFILPATVDHPANRYSKYTIQGGFVARHALQSAYL